MRTPEAVVKDGVKKYLNSLSGCYYFMPVQSGYGRRTVDFLGCYKGRFFAIETKAPGKTLGPFQAQILREVADAGGIAIWGDDADTINRDLRVALGV